MAVKQQEMQRAVKKTKTPVTNNPPENPDISLSEANEDIKLAFNAFINAKSELSEAVKEQEEQGKAASVNSEARYKIYRQIVEQAFKERETTEQQAMTAYRESVEKAGKIYREILQAALDKCKLITDKAWKNSLEPLAASPNGEKQPAGTRLKFKNVFNNAYHRTKYYTVLWFNKIKIFVKEKLISVKSADTASGRIE